MRKQTAHEVDFVCCFCMQAFCAYACTSRHSMVWNHGVAIHTQSKSPYIFNPSRHTYSTQVATYICEYEYLLPTQIVCARHQMICPASWGWRVMRMMPVSHMWNWCAFDAYVWYVSFMCAKRVLCVSMRTCLYVCVSVSMLVCVSVACMISVCLVFMRVSMRATCRWQMPPR